MTVWTDSTQQVETWANEPPAIIGVFSRDVFSHAYVVAQRVFAIGTAGVYDLKTIQAETWAEIAAP